MSETTPTLELCPVLAVFFCKDCGRILMMEHGFVKLDEDFAKHLKLSNEIMDDFEKKGMYILYKRCPICKKLIPARNEVIRRIVDGNK